MVDGGSVLDQFAHGAFSFLLALLALSIVTALISVAIEEYVRPWFQRRIVYRWASHAARRLGGPVAYLIGLKDISSVVEDAEQTFRIDPSLLVAAPDQVSAQVAKRVDLWVEARLLPELATDRRDPGGLNRELLLRQADALADLLQAQLTRSVTNRAYVSAAGVSLAIGAVLYVVAVRSPERGDAWTWIIVAWILAFVATLLSPLLQAAVGRLLRG
jgi:hypothetical protein